MVTTLNGKKDSGKVRALMRFIKGLQLVGSEKKKTLMVDEEASRERRSMTALPPVYYLRACWARRPLVASRAAVLASVLPEGADHKAFLHALGIHGGPVGA